MALEAGEMIIRQERVHINLLFSHDQQNVKRLSVFSLYYMYKMINKISRCGHDWKKCYIEIP